MTLKARLIADYICWIGTTIALVYFQHPTIAAVVGATGAVYLYNAQRVYNDIKYINDTMPPGNDLF